MSSYGFGPNWQAELPHHFAASSVAPRVPCASNVYDEPAIGYHHQSYSSAYASPTRHYSTYHQHAGHHGHAGHLQHGPTAHDGYASSHQAIAGTAPSFHLNPHAVAPSASPGSFHGHGLSITNLLQSQQQQHLAHLPHSQSDLQPGQVRQHDALSPVLSSDPLAAGAEPPHGQHLQQQPPTNYSSPTTGAPTTCKLNVSAAQRQQQLDSASVHSDSATTASSRGQTATGSPFSAESPSKTPEPASNGSAGDHGSNNKQYYPWMKSYTGKSCAARGARLFRVID